MKKILLFVLVIAMLASYGCTTETPITPPDTTGSPETTDQPSTNDPFEPLYNIIKAEINQRISLTRDNKYSYINFDTYSIPIREDEVGKLPSNISAGNVIEFDRTNDIICAAAECILSDGTVFGKFKIVLKCEGENLVYDYMTYSKPDFGEPLDHLSPEYPSEDHSIVSVYNATDKGEKLRYPGFTGSETYAIYDGTQYMVFRYNDSIEEIGNVVTYAVSSRHGQIFDVTKVDTITPELLSKQGHIYKGSFDGEYERYCATAATSLVRFTFESDNMTLHAGPYASEGGGDGTAKYTYDPTSGDFSVSMDFSYGFINQTVTSISLKATVYEYGNFLCFVFTESDFFAIRNNYPHNVFVFPKSTK